MADKNNPLISVVVPIYKVEEYLHDCVESIINQSYSNLEIILVNDGSPDGCAVICDRYAVIDGRIKVIHKDNGGLSSARNAGLKKSTGDWVSFIDSDDWVERSFIEELLGAALKKNASLSVCNFQYAHEDKSVLPYINPIKREFALSKNKAIEKIMTEQLSYDIIAVNKIYKRELFILNTIYYPERKINEDNYTTYKIYASSERIVYIPSTLYNYRQRSGSIMSTIQSRVYLDNIFNFTSEQIRYLTGKVPGIMLDVVSTLSHYNVLRMIDRKSLANVEDYKLGSISALRNSLIRIIFFPYISFVKKAKILYLAFRLK